MEPGCWTGLLIWPAAVRYAGLLLLHVVVSSAEARAAAEAAVIGAGLADVLISCVLQGPVMQPRQGRRPVS
jgi:hypothetical protein